MHKTLLFSIFFLLSALLVIAHTDEAETEGIEDIVHKLESAAVKSVIIASIIVGIVVLVSIYTPKKTEAMNWFLFLAITIPTILSTVFITGTTVLANVVSESGGPIHWHADFEIWDCGEPVDLIDPTGLLNRVGTSEYHEHNDNRVHVEGTIINFKEIDLHTFFDGVGGRLEKTYAAFPTNDGLIERRNGETCGGNNAELQVFVYRVTNPNAYSRDGFKYTQFKIEDFEEFLLAPYINVPPGDCIIIEFAERKDQTDKLCASYRVAEERGDIVRE